MFSQVKKSWVMMCCCSSIQRAARPGRDVARVALLAPAGHGEEVVGVLLVDRRVAGDLHRGQHLRREADESDAQAEGVVDDLAVDRAVRRQPRGRASPAVVHVHRGVEVVLVQLEAGRLGRPVAAVHRADVVRVGRVLHDHLRVHLHPVDHARVRVDRVVVAALELGNARAGATSARRRLGRTTPGPSRTTRRPGRSGCAPPFLQPSFE